MTFRVYAVLDALVIVRSNCDPKELGITRGYKAKKRVETNVAIVAAEKINAQPSRRLKFANIPATQSSATAADKISTVELILGNIRLVHTKKLTAATAATNPRIFAN